jgi:hypothetical protein
MRASNDNQTCHKCDAPMEWRWLEPPHDEICLACAVKLLRSSQATLISVKLPECKPDPCNPSV